MKHVLYIGPDYRNHRGGIGAVLAVYAAHIGPFKFISTYTPGSIPHIVWEYIRGLCSLCYTLLADRRIRIVHIHSSSRGSFYRKSLVLLISKLFGKRTILHIHGSEFHLFYENAGRARAWIRYIMRKSDAVVVLSAAWKAFVEKQFRVRRLVVVNNVIELPEGGEGPTPPDDKIHLLFLGLIGKRKGIFDLLQVLEDTEGRLGGRFLLTVGGNGETEKLQELIASRHLEDRVRFVGWVDGPRKKALLEACDLYILPSYNEGLPISILEALAYGKPVVSTRVGGIPEVVRPGFNGWLMEAGDTAQLTRILEEIGSNPQILKKYGRQSRSLAEQYAPPAVIRSLGALYDELFDNVHPKPVYDDSNSR